MIEPITHSRWLEAQTAEIAVVSYDKENSRRAYTFTQDDFERWFGDSVKRYTDRLPGFFDDDCCYGTWRVRYE